MHQQRMSRTANSFVTRQQLANAFGGTVWAATPRREGKTTIDETLCTEVYNGGLLSAAVGVIKSVFVHTISLPPGSRTLRNLQSFGPNTRPYRANGAVLNL
jgi:hypothetical protein